MSVDARQQAESLHGQAHALDDADEDEAQLLPTLGKWVLQVEAALASPDSP